ncbi:MAG: hypothetical protein ACRD3W_13790, partial [Terriglobales bacterium]
MEEICISCRSNANEALTLLWTGELGICGHCAEQFYAEMNDSAPVLENENGTMECSFCKFVIPASKCVQRPTFTICLFDLLVAVECLERQAELRQLGRTGVYSANIEPFQRSQTVQCRITHRSGRNCSVLITDALGRQTPARLVIGSVYNFNSGDELEAIVVGGDAS